MGESAGAVICRGSQAPIFIVSTISRMESVSVHTDFLSDRGKTTCRLKQEVQIVKLVALAATLRAEHTLGSELGDNGSVQYNSQLNRISKP